MHPPRQKDPVRSQLQRKRVAELRRLAVDFGLPVCADFTKSDLVDMLTERMTGDLSQPAGILRWTDLQD